VSTQYADVIIIGSGAGGGTLAHALAPSGKKILILERGEYLPREKDNWSPRAVAIGRKYRSDERWLDSEGRSHGCPTHYCVGGNTKFYGATLMRFRAEDFAALRHHGGVSPEWPITYADLEPYYSRAERLYQVHGERGDDPTEPFSSAPYLYPALRHEARIARLANDLRDAGLHPFTLPLGVMRDDARPEHSRCIRCDTCGGYPCLVQAKADAETICVRPALSHPNVSLLTGRTVTRLETDPTGRAVSSVHVDHGGEKERFTADIVIVSAGAINSAALLLRSFNDKHPHGLANRSGVVGRHYMRHIISTYPAISGEPNATVFQKTLGFNDYYLGDADFRFPLGHVQTLGKQPPEIYAAERISLPRGESLESLVPRLLELCAFSEDLPDPENRVTLDRTGATTVRYRPNNLVGHERLLARLDELLPRIGAVGRIADRSVYGGQRGEVDGANHQCGTVRFGRDPATSALDENCKAHDLDNLYVVDASFFVSSAAMNPALTIMANALRVGAHLHSRLGTSGGDA
jgi:choline dehydrogenase-like flavoprotein